MPRKKGAKLGSECSFRNSRVWCRDGGGPLTLKLLEALRMHDATAHTQCSML